MADAQSSQQIETILAALHGLRSNMPTSTAVQGGPSGYQTTNPASAVYQQNYAPGAYQQNPTPGTYQQNTAPGAYQQNAASGAYQQNPAPGAYQQTPTSTASTYQGMSSGAGLPPPVMSYSAYPLPQPTSSGSVDLSTITPVSSGTVSFADAIAKAKTIAADKGISPYDQSRTHASQAASQSHDAAHGAGHRHYRSRSRSPARRDPYRDSLLYSERGRDDQRAGSGAGGRDPTGRDRSLSPGRGRHSGSARDRGAEEEHDMMQIESSLVGLIIGRQGENLRRVEADTGCRVQFMSGPDQQGPYRQCRISGPRARRVEARAAIDKIIDESAANRAISDNKSHSGGRGAAAAAAHAPGPATLRDGEDCLQIMVPDRTVGLIIGRGGETIRDLQERSGCHINIVGESKSVNGLRPVNLIGTPQAAAQAKDAIMEIVDSDSRNGNGNGGGNGGGKPDRHQRQDFGARDVGAGNGGDKSSDSIYVPSEAVGMIIGKGGETIREMQNSTGCKINVSQSSGASEVEREIGLVGSRDAIAKAKLAIEDKVEAVRQKNNGGSSGRGGRRDGGPNRRDNDNGNNYSQQATTSGYQAHSQQPATGGYQANAAGGQLPGASSVNGASDPYAMYGGYQNYVYLWYQASLANGGQPGQPQGGDGSKPPGA